MKPVEQLYGWNDGKIYYRPDEDETLCVSDEEKLLQKLITVCERYYNETPPQTDTATPECYEPQVPQEVTTTDGTSYDLDDIAELIFTQDQYGEQMCLFNPETGQTVLYAHPDIVGHIDYEEFSEKEQNLLIDEGVIPDGWYILDNAPSRESWEFMKHFAQTIENPVTRQRVLVVRST